MRLYFFCSSVLKNLVLTLCLAGSCLGTALAQPAPVRLALIEGLSGPFANAGEAVWRNLAWAIERVNQRGGVLWEIGRAHV